MAGLVLHYCKELNVELNLTILTKKKNTSKQTKKMKKKINTQQTRISVLVFQLCSKYCKGSYEKACFPLFTTLPEELQHRITSWKVTDTCGFTNVQLLSYKKIIHT